MAFTFQAKYLGMSPWESRGTFSMSSFMEHGGIYHVMGRPHGISEAMAKVFEENGGRLHLSTAVVEILVDDGRAVGVRLADGQVVKADDVTIHADFAHAMTHLFKPERRRKYTDQRMRRKNYCCPTLMLYLGLDRLYDVPHHNQFEEWDHCYLVGRHPSRQGSANHPGVAADFGTTDLRTLWRSLEPVTKASH